MLSPMEPWVTIDELRVWTQRPISDDDEYADVVLRAATILVSTETGLHGTEDEFTIETAPPRLKVLTAQVAKRAYLNPQQITRDGNIGPIGGDTYAEAMAAGMELTETEEAVVAKVMTSTPLGSGGGISIIPLAPRAATDRDYRVPDSSGSDWNMIDPGYY